MCPIFVHFFFVTWEVQKSRFVTLSSGLQCLGYEWFLGTENIIYLLIHLTCLLLSSPSGHKLWFIYVGASLLPCKNLRLSWITLQPTSMRHEWQKWLHTPREEQSCVRVNEEATSGTLSEHKCSNLHNWNIHSYS